MSVLKDTTLCAIIRDEIMNPAGGIKRFINLHAPYVEKTVIIDTGSVDGTREALEELKKIHANIEVYDHIFDGYAKSRNFSLTKATTKRILVLDADERLTRKDFYDLSEFIENNPAHGYNFLFQNVTPKLTKYAYGHNPRLFSRLDGIEYKMKWEHLFRHDTLFERSKLNPNKLFGRKVKIRSTGITIKHFRPSEEALIQKEKEWYAMVQTNNPNILNISPSKIPSFDLWKEYNPLEKIYV